MGCYICDYPEETLLQLPTASSCKLKVPVHETSRSVRLQDLMRVYFNGKANMAQGYREINTPVASNIDPDVYASAMAPFFGLKE